MTSFSERAQHGGFMGGFMRGGRANRGDIGPLVLRLLLEKPMHGYEIIRTFEARSHGMWRPSAGSIYPTLQLLEEQELISSSEDEGKKVYSLTEKGREAAGNDQTDPWGSKRAHGMRFGSLRHEMRSLMMDVRRIGLEGSDEEFAALKGVLKRAAEEVSAISPKKK
jgi:DNA-binding PadR family transcriptional regulator